MRYYRVMTAAAAMPNSCWGTYRRVAVVEVATADTLPAMISERARGVVRIVKTWEKLNVGSTARCAYSRAVVAAEALVAKLVGEARVEDAIATARPVYVLSDGTTIPAAEIDAVLAGRIADAQRILDVARRDAATAREHAAGARESAEIARRQVSAYTEQAFSDAQMASVLTSQTLTSTSRVAAIELE